MRIGIVGLGTIGQVLAKALDRGEVAAQLTAVHSRNMARAQAFAYTLSRVPAVVDLAGVIAYCDLVIEAATQEALSAMAPAILKAGKDLMVLSVGAMLDHPEWPALAARHGCRLYVPYAFTTETVIFEGSAREACQGFPANVNVAAALSLAGIGPDCTRIRILVAPGNTRNIHDVEVEGEFGRLTTHIENVPTDNPRTGKLSYLSAIAMLKQIVSPCHYGT